MPEIPPHRRFWFVSPAFNSGTTCFQIKQFAPSNNRTRAHSPLRSLEEFLGPISSSS